MMEIIIIKRRNVRFLKKFCFHCSPFFIKMHLKSGNSNLLIHFCSLVKLWKKKIPPSRLFKWRVSLMQACCAWLQLLNYKRAISIQNRRLANQLLHTAKTSLTRRSFLVKNVASFINKMFQPFLLFFFNTPVPLDFFLKDALYLLIDWQTLTRSSRQQWHIRHEVSLTSAPVLLRQSTKTHHLNRKAALAARKKEKISCAPF